MVYNQQRRLTAAPDDRNLRKHMRYNHVSETLPMRPVILVQADWPAASYFYEYTVWYSMYIRDRAAENRRT